MTKKEWVDAMVEQNILQMNSAETIRRVSRLLRARIEPLGEGLWSMLRDGSKIQATQAALAGSIKHSRLLGDFMDITIRDQRQLFANSLKPTMWGDYIEGCRGRDPDMPHWGDATVVKLRSVVFCILAEAGYLQNTKRLLMQNVYVDGQLAAYLRDNNESYVLKCMEVME